MDYNVNIIVHILHRSNLGWILTYMGAEDPNGSFMDTWLDSPYIYDIYDTNDGDSMTVMTQFRYEGWNTDIMKCQDWIYHLRGLIWELEKAKTPLLKFGRSGKVKREANDIAWEATPIRLGFGLWMDLEPYKTNNFYKIHGSAMTRIFFSFVNCES